MKQSRGLQNKARRSLQDRLAQVSGYKDHADALAHKDPVTGIVPVRTAKGEEKDHESTQS